MGYGLNPATGLSISVYSLALDPIGIVESFSACTLRLNFFSVGSFEIELPSTPRMIDLLQKNRIIDFGANGEIAGIIEGVWKNLRPTGVTLRIYGSMLNGLMRRRMVVPSDDPALLGWDVASGTVGSIFAHYVTNHAIAPSQIGRIGPLLRLAPGIEKVGMKTVQKARFQPVYEVLQGVAQFATTGWRIVIASDSMYEFQALSVVDRTAESDNPLVLSTANQNISTADYGTDMTDYANAVYALGEGSYENRLYQVYYPNDDPVSGWERCETVVDCGNEDSLSRLRDLALQKIADLEKTDSMTLQVIVGKADVNLGDMVTVELPEIGARYDLVITEMVITRRGGSSDIGITLGKPPRTLTNQLQRASRLQNIT